MNCPNCGKPHDTRSYPQAPFPGVYVSCEHCGALLVYEQDLTLAVVPHDCPNTGAVERGCGDPDCEDCI